MSFLCRDVVVATAMGVLSLTWLVVGLTLYTSPSGSTSDALGLQLLVSIAAMAFIAITAASGVLVAAAIFGLASVPFLVTAIYELSGSDGWKTAAGVVGVVLVALALYGAWAAQLEAAAGRTVLPLGRRGKGREAIYGSLLEQVKDIAHQPGVRERL